MRHCDVCGRTENETKIIKNMCRKHYLQMYRHGKTFHTIYDGNEFIEHKDYIEIVTKDKNGNNTNSFIIDKDDFKKCKDLKWYNKNGYCRTTSTTPRIFLHQLILNYYGEDDIDHLNGVTTDNRKSNLSIKSHKDNMRNMHKNKVRGIKKVPSGNFQASITVDYKGVYLGTFNSYEEAVIARKDAELLYYGEHVN